MLVFEGGRVEGLLTTLRVPMRTLKGDWSAATISAMKLALSPMMVIREMACIARTTVKVAPRAPMFAFAIMNLVEGGVWVLKVE
jgi:hypothetical protein